LVDERGGVWGTGRFPTLARRRGLVGETWFPPPTRAEGGCCSFSLGRLLAQQTLWTEDEDSNKDCEDDRARPVTARREPREALVEGLDEPDDERAQDGAGEIADTAEDGRGEGDQAELEARVVADVVLEEEHEAGHGGEPTRDEERDGDRPVHVDAHHRRRLGVLGDRAHRLALPRVPHEPAQHEERWHDDRERDDELPGEADVADLERRALRNEVGAALVVHAVEGERDVGDDERHPDRGDQRRQTRCVAERPVRDPLDRRVDDGEQRDRDRERDDDPPDDREVARVAGQTEHRKEEGARHEAREREHVAVGEVDELEDAVDQRVPERDDAVDRAARQTVEGHVDELRGPLEEVDHEPDAHDRHEAETDAVDDPWVAKPPQEPGERVSHRIARL
jgi:hypothetical protein